MLVLKNGKKGESYNISAANEIDNIEIAKKILKMLNKSDDNIQFVKGRPGEDTRYSLDSTKIRNELGWKSKITFEEGLEETIQWYHSNKEWWNQKPIISNPWEK